MRGTRLLFGLAAVGSAALVILALQWAPDVGAQQLAEFVVPHGNYSESTELCGLCHDSHTTADPENSEEQPYPSEGLLARSSEAAVCFTCHDGSASDSNVAREYGADTRTSFHSLAGPSGEVQLTCADCHARHQSPDEDVMLLYRELAPGAFVFSPPTAPIGDTFCYGCHGSASTLPEPLGDHGLFETSIHDTSDAVEPPTPGTDLKCSACHEPHASDFAYLTREDGEQLCFTCHSSKEPNTANGSDPEYAFTAAQNDYVNDDETGDGNPDGIRVYHHPVAEGDQADGARVVECGSCHNSHIVTPTVVASDPARARAMDSGWDFAWDPTSGGYNRSPNAAAFCGTCHVDPSTTEPIPPDVDVPYDVRLANDTALDHDRFSLAWYTQGASSAHGNPSYAASDYPGCQPGQDCSLACTACHDAHGSSNAYMLREDVSSPDYRPLSITDATWTPGVDGAPATAEVEIGPHAIQVGWWVTISGIAPGEYVGDWQVTAVTPTTISFEMAANPGSYVGGGTLVTGGPYARASSATITGFGGLDTPSDRNKLQTFCLTCHLETPTTHMNDSLCTECHSHDPTGAGGF